jgi:hypothetical protein
MNKGGKKKAIGILFILLSLICFISGGYIWYMNSRYTDISGFTISEKIKLSTDSASIVFSDHHFNMKEELPSILQIVINPDNFMSERWTIQNNLEKDVFIGIAVADKAQDYSKLMHYKEADDWDITGGPWEIEIWVNTYQNHLGTDSTQPPRNADIWLASGSGKDVAEFEKTMVTGEYWVMIMNVDGSPGLDVDLHAGYKMPLILGLSNILIGIGFVLGACSIILYILSRARSLIINHFTRSLRHNLIITSKLF